MANITNIEPQKRKGRYNIYVDDKFYCGIDAEGLVKSGYKVGSEVTVKELEQNVFESELRSAFNKLADLIARKPYSKSQLKSKLIDKGYSINVIDKAINKAEEYGYVNDDQYAKMYIEAKKNKSKREIISGLYGKGINKNIINKNVQIISEQSEFDNAWTLANKYMKNRPKERKEFEKLYAYLYRKGFQGECINSVLKKFKFDEFDTF